MDRYVIVFIFTGPGCITSQTIDCANEAEAEQMIAGAEIGAAEWEVGMIRVLRLWVPEPA